MPRRPDIHMHQMSSRLQGDARADELLDEARILARTRDDPASFAPLYETYLPRIYAYCLRQLGRPEEAENMTSTVFARALSGAHAYRGGSVPAWLFRIAHNAVANSRRERRHLLLEDADAGLSADRAANPTLDQVIDAEQRQQVARLISALPEEQQELLSLRVTHGLSAKEIGVVIGKREGAVRMALHRVVQHLARQLREAEEGRHGQSLP